MSLYKVLLVDDERIILEGISSIIDWQAHGTELQGTARNGVEAFGFIAEHQPDIVISDIRMPGMDGLQLIEKTKAAYPRIEFILLSGFSEFEYARTAMRFGVTQYLMKPCNENAIASALGEIVGELNVSRERQAFLERLQAQYKTMLPHAKEQFLKEMATNKTYGPRDWELYRQLFQMPIASLKVRLLLIQLEGGFEFEHMFAVKNIAEDIMDDQTLLLSTTIGEHVLLLISDPSDEAALLEKIQETRRVFLSYYKIDMTMALSGSDDMTRVRALYKETLACLQHRFYLGEGSLITSRDIVVSGANEADAELDIDTERIALLVKAGRREAVQLEIRSWFDALAGARLDVSAAQSYVIPFYAAIARLDQTPNRNDYMKQLAQLDKLDTLTALHELVSTAAGHITAAYYESNVKKNSTVIQKAIDIIRSNLGNPQLNLNWVAKEMLYMNADYLGKLFKKETGQKFSSYVVQLRIDAAVELMNGSEDIKVFEVAERLGFGDNPQYFSQVFKKMVGCAPSEYKRTPQTSDGEGKSLR